MLFSINRNDKVVTSFYLRSNEHIY